MVKTFWILESAKMKGSNNVLPFQDNDVEKCKKHFFWL